MADGVETTRRVGARIAAMTKTMLQMWPHAAGLLVVAGLMAFFAPEAAYGNRSGACTSAWGTNGSCRAATTSTVFGRSCRGFSDGMPGPPLRDLEDLRGALPRPARRLAMCVLGAGDGMSSASTARMVAWLTALGSGACYTLFDPYTSDPLMHRAWPALMLADRSRPRRARDRGCRSSASSPRSSRLCRSLLAPRTRGTAATSGRRREPAGPRRRGRRVGMGGVATVRAQRQLHYTTGPTYSADRHHRRLPGVLAAHAESRTLVDHADGDGAGRTVAAVAGRACCWGPRELRQLTFASVPALLIFNALQQPDRALWNFAFLLMPAVAIVLDRVPPVLGWLFVAAQGRAQRAIWRATVAGAAGALLARHRRDRSRSRSIVRGARRNAGAPQRPETR